MAADNNKATQRISDVMAEAQQITELLDQERGNSAALSQQILDLKAEADRVAAANAVVAGAQHN